VITEDTTLQADLTCSGDGLIIGADRVTLDLGGHTVSSTCEPTAGPAIADAGYNGLRLLNGTVSSGGPAAFRLDDSTNSALEGLTVGHCQLGANQPGVALSLSSSDHNRIVDTTALGGDPAVLLSDSDRNAFSATTVRGGIGMHWGDGIRLIDGSDGNRLSDDQISAGGNDAIGIFSSAGNRLTRSAIGIHVGDGIRLIDGGISLH
jgi:hypothetical protein